jgi:hypothetical protein
MQDASALGAAKKCFNVEHAGQDFFVEALFCKLGEEWLLVD